jgi:3-hydroxybutyryl-CoA dehydratase
MNEYTIDTIQVGVSASFNTTFTLQMIKQFQHLCGDPNPLHCDEAWAKIHGFKTEVIYGMMTASLYSRLVGEYLPGKYCLLQRVETDFVAPVYANDELTIEGTVKSVHIALNRIEVKASIANTQKKVSRAIIYCGFYAK